MCGNATISRNTVNKPGPSLNALLDKYANLGITAIEKLDILKIQPLSEFGTPLEIIKIFGGKEQYLEALQELEKQLYAAA